MALPLAGTSETMAHSPVPQRAGPAPAPNALTLTLRRKQPQDTPGGCRALAAADLSRAEALVGEHVRWRYEHSAQAWLARADLLERLETKFQARLRNPRC